MIYACLEILGYERLKNTYYGNPRYQLFLSYPPTGEFINCKTKGDYACVYGLFNNEPYIYDADIRETKKGNKYLYNCETKKRGE